MGEEYRRFTGRAEADKAINSLRGIVEGIMLDHNVNNKELQELDYWCEKHQHLIKMNPFQEFMHTIRKTLRSEQDLGEALEDLYWLSQRYQEDNIYYNALTADMQTLQGICHGILADAVINEPEVKALQEWADKNRHLANTYPYAELYTLLQKILADGVVDEMEKLELKAFFRDFIKLNDKKLMRQIEVETADIKIGGLCTFDADITADGKVFCITGNLSRGSKVILSNLIDDQGGTCREKVTNLTDFLIVGNEGSEAWAFSCYGRKVEDAMKRRKKGQDITILHENDFYDYIDNLYYS